jgi:hypothetical protein
MTDAPSDAFLAWVARQVDELLGPALAREELALSGDTLEHDLFTLLVAEAHGLMRPGATMCWPRW